MMIKPNTKQNETIFDEETVRTSAASGLVVSLLDVQQSTGPQFPLFLIVVAVVVFQNKDLFNGPANRNNNKLRENCGHNLYVYVCV